MTAVRYRNEVLEPIVRLYVAADGPTFVLMNDKASPHRVAFVEIFVPFENLWEVLCRAVFLHFPPPVTLIELKTTLQEEWRLLNT